jgi:hypothetical protein
MVVNELHAMLTSVNFGAIAMSNRNDHKDFVFSDPHLS